MAQTDQIDPHQSARSPAGHVDPAARGPLLLLLMALVHVAGLGGGTGSMLTRMGRHRPLTEVQGDQGVNGVQLQGLADVLMRYRVMMLLIVHVIVDVDLHRLDLDIAVSLRGQRPQGGLH